MQRPAALNPAVSRSSGMDADSGTPMEFFQAALKEIVVNTEDADGAIFLDSEGEAVQWYARADSDLLRLRAAYIAVTLQTCRLSVGRLGLGAISHLVIEYEGAWYIIQELTRDYFFVLQLTPSANLAQAIERIQPVVDSLKREIAA
jgi:predicted regulator of Ras-like GTPase activity (Roadblock/LC7/MglB family)